MPVCLFGKEGGDRFSSGSGGGMQGRKEGGVTGKWSREIGPKALASGTCHQYPPSPTGADGALSPQWLYTWKRQDADSPRKQLTRVLSDLKITLPLKLFWEEILWVIIYVGDDIYKDTYPS